MRGRDTDQVRRFQAIHLDAKCQRETCMQSIQFCIQAQEATKVKLNLERNKPLPGFRHWETRKNQRETKQRHRNNYKNTQIGNSEVTYNSETNVEKTRNTVKQAAWQNQNILSHVFGAADVGKTSKILPDSNWFFLSCRVNFTSHKKICDPWFAVLRILHL